MCAMCCTRKLCVSHASRLLKTRCCSSSNGSASDTVPKLIYFVNPFTHLMTKVHLAMLKMTWDPEFNEKEFKRGASKAVLQITEMIRSGQVQTMQRITTPTGFNRLYKDTMLSLDDPRLSLLRFREKDIKKVYPTKVVFAKRDNNSHLFIDMFFAMIRSADSMSSTANDRVLQNLSRIEDGIRKEGRTKIPHENEAQRLILAEMFARFHRDYSKTPEWNIEFYKVEKLKIIYTKN